MLEADQLFGCRRPGREEVLEPAEGRRDGGVLVAQPLEELDQAGRRHGRAQPAQRGRADLAALLVEAQDPVGKFVRVLPCGAAPNDLLRQAPEILDERDPETDRDRPELADRQRFDSLVRLHEPDEAVRIEAAVSMRNIGPCQAKIRGYPWRWPPASFGSSR